MWEAPQLERAVSARGISATINNFKEHNPSALITVAYLEEIQTIYEDGNHPDRNTSDEEEVKWEKDEQDQ